MKPIITILAALIFFAPAYAIGKVRTLSIGFTNNINGNFRDCGCESSERGSLARRPAAIKKLAESGGKPLLLDGGDLLAESTLVAADRLDVGRASAKLVIDYYKELGVSAIAVGDQDLALGADFLRELDRANDGIFLSSNLVDKTSGEPIFGKGRIIKSGGVKIGIFSLIESGIEIAALGGCETMEIMDPLAVARSETERLIGEGAELIILLAHLGERAETEIAREVEQIDVILSGHYSRRDPPRVVNGALIANAFSDGIYLLGLQLYLHDEPPYRFTSFVWGTRAPPGRSTTYAAQLIDHGPRLKSDDDFIKKLDEITKHDIPAAAPRLDYIGSPEYNCRRCHAKAYGNWAKDAHSRAWSTLSEERDECTPECVGCHSTGFRSAGGAQTLGELPPFQNVGCESCHGPARGHGSRADRPKKKINKSTCLPCHNSKNSPAFSYNSYRKRLNHP